MKSLSRSGSLSKLVTLTRWLSTPENRISDSSTEIETNQTIQISATPKSNDIIGLQDLFLQFDTGESNINVIEDNILSGADPTGIRFISTPTNYNNNVIRPRL